MVIITAVLMILLAILVLGILIFVHELGHFSIAKLFKIRVDEFGFGFPPKIWGRKKGETEYTLNWLPFGGFVRIFGEDYETPMTEEEAKRSFIHKPKLAQIAVLAAGVIFNIIFAWLLISIVVGLGFPASVGTVPEEFIKDPKLTVVGVSSDSPASLAGIEPRDEVLYLKYGVDSYVDLNSDTYLDTVSMFGAGEYALGYFDFSENEEKEVLIKGVQTTLSDGSTRYLAGIQLDMIGNAEVPLKYIPTQGFKLTWSITKQTIVGYASLITDVFKGKGGEVLAVVSGPLSIIYLISSAAEIGLSSLLLLAAVISISLAIVNLLPFPALDGGRILFVIIESIKGSPIKSNIAGIVNAVGFFILIGLLIIVTFSDAIKIFG